MIIIVLLYIGVAWLVFFRLKLLPWNWPWRIVSRFRSFLYDKEYGDRDRTYHLSIDYRFPRRKLASNGERALRDEFSDHVAGRRPVKRPPADAAHPARI